MNYQRSDISRCANCFEEVDEKDSCPYCSEHSDSRSPLALAQGTILNGNYQLGKVLGKLGGFGITYLAWDRTLEMKVAIKEYLPRELAGRDQNHVTVIPHSEFDGEDYQKGLEKFLQEARTLASIDHPNIVRVRGFFRENNSAYLVMDYYEGTTLEEYVRVNGGRITEQQAVAIMVPILDGLKDVHSKNILHRDIKPENIYLTRSGRVILLDFGASKQVLQGRSRSMTIVMTPGFSPIEQILGIGMQGPWTDIYACSATLYYIITGVIPQRSDERLANDRLLPIRQINKDTSYDVEIALIRGMEIREENRIQSVSQLQESISPYLKHNETQSISYSVTIKKRRWKYMSIVGIVAGVYIIYMIGYEYLSFLFPEHYDQDINEMFEECWEIDTDANSMQCYEYIAKHYPNTKYGLYSAAWTNWKRNNVAVSLELCDSILNRSQSFWYANYLRSVLKCESGDMSSALHDINIAINANSSITKLYLQRAAIYLEIDNDTMAIYDYHTILKKDTNNVDALKGLARVSLKHDLNKELKYYAKEILNRKPNDLDALIYESCVMYKDGFRPKAISRLTDLIARFPREPYLFHVRGYLKSLGGDRIGSIRDYNEALLLKPNYPNVLLNRAIEREELGDYHGAEEDYAKAIKTRPQRSELYMKRGYNRYTNLSNKRGACEDWRMAAELGEENAYYNLRLFCK